MVLDADFIEEISEPEIEEISEPEIELEEVEEVSLLPGPSSCPKTYLGLNRNLLGMVNNQLNYLPRSIRFGLWPNLFWTYRKMGHM